MIQINEKPVVSVIILHKTCATINITNYPELPLGFLKLMANLTVIINTVTYFPDVICVVLNENLDEFVNELTKVSLFCKIETMELK